jgi:hypothetical protein
MLPLVGSGASAGAHRLEEFVALRLPPAVLGQARRSLAAEQ